MSLLHACAVSLRTKRHNGDIMALSKQPGLESNVNEDNNNNNNSLFPTS